MYWQGTWSGLFSDFHHWLLRKKTQHFQIIPKWKSCNNGGWNQHPQEFLKNEGGGVAVIKKKTGKLRIFPGREVVRTFSKPSKLQCAKQTLGSTYSVCISSDLHASQLEPGPIGIQLCRPKHKEMFLVVPPKPFKITLFLVFCQVFLPSPLCFVICSYLSDPKRPWVSSWDTHLEWDKTRVQIYCTSCLPEHYPSTRITE